MICASKDPLVDDTIVFGGRLREAKLRRQMEARMAGSLHGEGLRMSASAPAARDPIVDQTEADWVSTSIVEGWSHGFLQVRNARAELQADAAQDDHAAARGGDVHPRHGRLDQ